MRSRPSGPARSREAAALRSHPVRGADPVARKLRGGAVALSVAGSLALLAACGHAGGNTAGAGLTASPGGSLPGMAGAAGSAPRAMPGMAGAAGSASPAMPGMAMPPPSGRAGGTPARPGAADAVDIKGFAFAPAALTVPVGTKVTWTNEDSDAHTVTSQGSGGPLNSKAMTTDDTFSYTFTKPGTYRYLCTIHPFMTATVTVTP